jgi:hypothetical protein
VAVTARSVNSQVIPQTTCKYLNINNIQSWLLFFKTFGLLFPRSSGEEGSRHAEKQGRSQKSLPLRHSPNMPDREDHKGPPLIHSLTVGSFHSGVFAAFLNAQRRLRGVA